MRYLSWMVLAILFSRTCSSALVECPQSIVRTRAVEVEQCVLPDELGQTLAQSSWDPVQNVLKLIFDPLPSGENPHLDSIEYEDNKGNRRILPCDAVWSGELGIYECKTPEEGKWEFRNVRISQSNCGSWADYERLRVRTLCDEERENFGVWTGRTHVPNVF